MMRKLLIAFFATSLLSPAVLYAADIASKASNEVEHAKVESKAAAAELKGEAKEKADKADKKAKKKADKLRKKLN